MNKINVSDALVHGLGIEVAAIKYADRQEVERNLRHLKYSSGDKENGGIYRGKRYWRKDGTQ